jgi:hypothetical protein
VYLQGDTIWYLPASAVSSLAALTDLNLNVCPCVTDEVLQTLRSLTALTTLNLRSCPNVSAEVLQALRRHPQPDDCGPILRTPHLPPPYSCCHPAFSARPAAPRVEGHLA